MVFIGKILSRGVAGAELEALSVARLFGVATGGNTRIPGTGRGSGVVRRYGLSSDPCSRRQALLRNIRQADGTLVFGRFGRELESLLGAERSHYCCIERLREQNVSRVVAWVRRHEIRTLNIVGSAAPDAAFFARVVMVEIFKTLGARPRLPQTATGPACGAVIVAGSDTLYAFDAWPEPAAWRWSERDDQWRDLAAWKADPELGETFGSLRWVTEVFFKRVPPHVRKWITHEVPATGPFQEGQVFYDLGLLEALGRLGNPAEDLARAGRWAVLRLACHAGAGLTDQLPAQRDWDAIRPMLGRRQRDIAASFGFPKAESTARILAKVSRGSCSDALLLDLRALVSDEPVRRVLQSLPCVNRAVIAVLSDPWLRRVIGPRLLREIASHRSRATLMAGLGDISVLLCRLQGEAERAGKLNAVRAMNSMRSLERTVNELENHCDAGHANPPAELPGIAGTIEPLTDGRALFVEGRKMRHCARQYALEVRTGRCLMFRILPDPSYGTSRATLQLRPGSDGTWRIAQLAGPGNTPIDCETARFLKTWLFFAQCDPTASEDQLIAACMSESRCAKSAASSAQVCAFGIPKK